MLWSDEKSINLPEAAAVQMVSSGRNVYLFHFHITGSAAHGIPDSIYFLSYKYSPRSLYQTHHKFVCDLTIPGVALVCCRIVDYCAVV